MDVEENHPNVVHVSWACDKEYTCQINVKNSVSLLIS